MKELVVAIIGRPNTGKSTLFNRLSERQAALVHDRPGMTRDRRKAQARLYEFRFHIIDTAGYVSVPYNSLEEQMCQQTQKAIDEADLVFFVIDSRGGILVDDENLARILHHSGKPVVLIANKVEGPSAQSGCLEACELGFGEPVCLSSEHGLGIADLRDAFIHTMEDKGLSNQTFIDQPDFTRRHQKDTSIRVKKDQKSTVPEREKPLKIAVAGQPNAGKSTLINSLLEEERLLAGPEAGMTRDAVSVEWKWENRLFRLFDTAGLRKKAKIREQVEKLATQDSLRAIFFAEVVIILLDATLPFEKQDLKIANLVLREGRALVIVFSKWDLVDDPEKMMTELRQKTADMLPQAAGVAIVAVSAQRRQGLNALMQAVVCAEKIWNTHLPTGPLNRWLEKVLLQHPPPSVEGRRSRIKYITQAKTRPPSFVVSCTRPEQISASYLRHLVNRLRESFEIPGVPIRILLRTSANPFSGQDRKKR